MKYNYLFLAMMIPCLSMEQEDELNGYARGIADLFALYHPDGPALGDSYSGEISVQQPRTLYEVQDVLLPPSPPAAPQPTPPLSPVEITCADEEWIFDEYLGEWMPIKKQSSFPAASISKQNTEQRRFDNSEVEEGGYEIVSQATYSPKDDRASINAVAGTKRKFEEIENDSEEEMPFHVESKQEIFQLKKEELEKFKAFLSSIDESDLGDDYETAVCFDKLTFSQNGISIENENQVLELFLPFWPKEFNMLEIQPADGNFPLQKVVLVNDPKEQGLFVRATLHHRNHKEEEFLKYTIDPLFQKDMGNFSWFQNNGAWCFQAFLPYNEEDLVKQFYAFQRVLKVLNKVNTPGEFGGKPLISKRLLNIICNKIPSQVKNALFTKKLDPFKVPAPKKKKV